MSKINDGGPAFPCVDEERCLASDGISVRDYFAAKALLAILAEDGYGGKECAVRQATDAYIMADAMLAARQTGGAA